MRSAYPDGLKPGDFVQTTAHFGDVFFEVASCIPPRADSGLWFVTYYMYDKYGRVPRTQWVNSASAIRAVIPAEMAIPVMRHKRLRFHASFGRYDPIFGLTLAATPPRTA